MLTHLFWALGTLSQRDCLCLAGFAGQGYPPLLWPYGGVDNPPAGSLMAQPAIGRPTP